MAGDQLAGQLDSGADPGMEVGVVEQHGTEAAEFGRPLPAAELVVVELGELGAEARELAVLVDLRLQAERNRRRQAAPGDLRDLPLYPAREPFGDRVLVCVRPPLGGELLRV